jgi:stage II sporulation protein D
MICGASLLRIANKIAALRSTFIAAMLTCAVAHGESSHDGGRDVSVMLFSTRNVSAITLAPLSSNVWVANCAHCARKPLSTSRQLAGSFELFAGGALRVTDKESREQRSATGMWHLRSRSDAIDVVLTLPSERYVAAVLNSEAAPDEPSASLQALAIVARTYALNGNHFKSAPSHLTADLCDSTQCQALRLGQASAAIDDAVKATAGETLWFRGQRAEAFFSEHCGGTTEDAAAVWPQYHALTYLVSHADPYCTRRKSSAWHAEVALADLLSIAASQGWHLPEHITSVSVAERSHTHRVLRIKFENGSETASINAGALRFGIDRALGWSRVRSDLYDLALRHGMLVFDGRGYGHGVGLCQTGAAEMAAERRTAREILRFYFPGASVRIGPNDDGWVITHTRSLTLRSAAGLPPARQEGFEEIWRTALQRFPLHGVISPQITLAPSTELFRQLTAQPGWALGSTRGSQIVLQPDMIFRKSGSDASTTVLHEMLHVLVESAATDRAPLWLREGFVAELAGESHSSATPMTPEIMDAALLHGETRTASQHAHNAAALRVHSLIARYGISVARGWLVSGIPSGVE